MSHMIMYIYIYIISYFVNSTKRAPHGVTFCVYNIYIYTCDSHAVLIPRVRGQNKVLASFAAVKGKFNFRDSQSTCGLNCRKHWQAWRFWELGGGRLNLALTRKPTSSGLGGIFCCVTCFRIREDNSTCSQGKF